MTQKEKILSILEDGNWHCTNEFYASYMADPRKRLHELRQKFTLEWRWCQQHDHKKSKEWHLIGREEKKVEVSEYYNSQGQIQKRTFNGVEMPITSMEKNFEIIQRGNELRARILHLK